jgi:hypothetical protein
MSERLASKQLAPSPTCCDGEPAAEPAHGGSDRPGDACPSAPRLVVAWHVLSVDAILAIVLLNAAIGFDQAYRAERAIAGPWSTPALTSRPAAARPWWSRPA